MIESLPASVSPRRMAKPPPITQMVPKMKPKSMTMPIALLAPCERLPAASMGIARVRNRDVFMRIVVSEAPNAAAPPVEPFFRADVMNLLREKSAKRQRNNALKTP